MKLSEQKLNVLCVIYQTPAIFIGGSGNQAKTIKSLVNAGLIERWAGGYVVTDKGRPFAKAEYDQRVADRAKARSMDDIINDPEHILKSMTGDLRRLQKQTIPEDVAPLLAAFVYELSQDVNIMSLLRKSESAKSE